MKMEKQRLEHGLNSTGSFYAGNSVMESSVGYASDNFKMVRWISQKLESFIVLPVTLVL